MISQSGDDLPHASGVEYISALPASFSLSKEKRAAAVVAVEDPVTQIFGFAPETGSRTADTLRIVALSILFGLIERTKAERYREVDPLDPDKESFAAGFDQCVEVVAHDSSLAGRLQDKIEAFVAKEGAESLKARLAAGLASRTMVPANYTPATITGDESPLHQPPTPPGAKAPAAIPPNHQSHEIANSSAAPPIRSQRQLHHRLYHRPH